MKKMKTSVKNQISKSKLCMAVFVFAIISMLSIGCTPTPTPTPCNTSNTLFHQIFTNVATAPGDTDIVTYDSEVHEYYFKLSANKTVCSIGYQSHPTLPTYLIQLRDSTTQTTLFSYTGTFSASATSYVSVPTVALTAGHIYTVRRIAISYGGLFSNIVGRIAKKNGAMSLPSFPYTVGVMSVIGSNFYQNAGAAPIFGIPFIDIVFQ